mgnify:FL=1
MIVEGILSVVFGIINLILMPLNVVNFVVNALSFEPIIEFINMALYLIPFKELMPIFVFFVSMMLFRIAVAFIKTIWDLLPVL